MNDNRTKPVAARKAVAGQSAVSVPVPARPPKPEPTVERPLPPSRPAAETGKSGGVRRLLQRLLRRRNQQDVIRDAIEELIEEAPAPDSGISANERVLLHNILTLRDLTVTDVMVPRVDIVAVPADTPLARLVSIMGRDAHSRLPVYAGSLDNTIGMVHIKDVLPYWNSGKRFNLSDVVRRVLFVAPTMKVLDMLLEMRSTRIHMALVVDEFGGIDGLLTIEDLVEEIVGEIEDEHDIDETVPLVMRADGSVDALARTPIEEFEKQFGNVFDEDERDNIDTLGGLVFSLAGRIPQRGELIRHPSGIEFEVLDVDPRRIRRLRIRNLPPVVQREASNTA